MLNPAMRRLALFVFPFVCSVAVIACGSSSPSATPTPTAPVLSGTPTVFSTIIPGISPLPPTSGTPAPPDASEPPPPAATYLVVDGDNPTAIARKLNVPDSGRDAWVQQLLSLNGVSANALRAGQVLKLPAADAGNQAAAKPPLGEVGGTPAPNLPLPANLVTPQALLPTPAVGAQPGASVCSQFSTQKVRDWCSRPFAAPKVGCEDFAKGTGEATRFTKSLDPLDVNGLDPDHDGKSCDDK